MKKVNLKLTGVNSKFDIHAFADGKEVKLKENNYSGYDGTFETEKEAVTIELVRRMELLSKLWFLYALVTFIVSVFGIFEPLYDKRCLEVNFKIVVSLKEGENNVKVAFNSPKDQEKVGKIEADAVEVKNQYAISKKAKNRWKLMLALKILFWLALIGVSIYLLATKL